MKIYVGRWDLLPEGWDGVNGFYDGKSNEDIILELGREIETMYEKYAEEDNRMGVYTPEEFEVEFNFDLKGEFNTGTYWIKFI